LAGTSFGKTENTLADLSAYPFPRNDALVLDELEKRHVDRTLYSDGATGVETILGPTLGVRWSRSVTGTLDRFYRDAAAGKLPAVSLRFIEARFRVPALTARDANAAIRHAERTFRETAHAHLLSSRQKESVSSKT
jgi:hypothetical protein